MSEIRIENPILRIQRPFSDFIYSFGIRKKITVIDKNMNEQMHFIKVFNANERKRENEWYGFSLSSFSCGCCMNTPSN